MMCSLLVGWHDGANCAPQLVIGGRNKYLINGHVAQPRCVRLLPLPQGKTATSHHVTPVFLDCLSDILR